MSHHLEDRILNRKMTRRDFLWLMAVSSAGAATGCAVNPVTGEKQLMLMSEGQEIQVDKEQSPHQFSNDYGVVQDPGLNKYIAQLGNGLAEKSHRPQMPYSFQAVNASYVNAYTFPAGSVATTRGIMVELDNEAELAGLLGHEIGHVNARHAGQRATKGMLAGLATTGAVALLQTSKYKDYAPMVQQAAGFGAGALLAYYSRDNERQADGLGMDYMTLGGQNPNGMVGLMEVLQGMSKHKPSAIEMMFATHPMSDERYETAKRSAAGKYKHMRNASLNKERYMDNTAGLRKIKGAIEAMQNGEKHMAKEEFDKAASQFDKALRIAPDDYAALVLMAKCQVAMNKPDQARRYSERAKRVNPTEAQAHHVNGVAQLAQNRFQAAYRDFSKYERLLPGNPNTIFLKAVSLESMHNKPEAAREYNRYLRSVRGGEQAQYAQQRLVNWGYMKRR
ncbi:MAG: M48 family metalloprotease [Gammaproteobacteria bacterium]|nr:M48 family metalloprotease [Gammaproteobacteria bacterium]